MLAEDAAVVVQDEGEGWFPLAPACELRGIVVRAIPHSRSDEPFYLLRLAAPLEVQEPGEQTPSGLKFCRYSHLVVRSRWQGVALGSPAPVSAHIWLIPEGDPVPTSGSKFESLAPRVWATCKVAA